MENQQISELLLSDQSSIQNFRRALRKNDQEIFDDLFLRIRDHAAAIRISVHPSRFEAILLALLLEEHKEVTRLRQRIEEAQNIVNNK